MEEKQNWLTIAAVVLVIAALGVFLYRQSQQQPEEISIPTQDEVAEQRADQLLETLDVDIPENAERVNLRDVSGGEAAGVATRVEEGETVSQELLVALPEPEAGEFYEAYLLSDDEETDPVYLGRLRSMKGGWILEYQLTEENQGMNTVQVTKETTDDQTPEEVVLEGTFEGMTGQPDETSENETDESSEDGSEEDSSEVESGS